jgi:asparagine synthase (glutamine-hydrolysing)
MCAIIGHFSKGSEDFAKKACKIMKNRGKDNVGLLSGKGFTVAHLLHSIVGFVKQPLEYKGSILLANCEIYNYEELAVKYSLNVLNDADLMVKLIGKIGLLKAIDEFDGVYSACYINKGKAYLFRDKIGEKPLWFSKKPFCFASEKKALSLQGIKCVNELNPRNMIIYDINMEKFSMKYLGFLKTKKVESPDWAITIRESLINAVKKRVPKGVKIGVLFSGGIDSTFIAFILKKLGVDFTCYAAGAKESEDVKHAINAANIHGFKIKKIIFDNNQIKKDLPTICEIIESNNAVKVGVSIPFYYACKEAESDGVKVIFSGLGSEELFAGYKRFESSSDVNAECVYGLKQLYERDLYRDDCLTMHHGIELRLPFLDYGLIDAALSLPANLKISSSEKKIILRDAAKGFGIDESIYGRKKMAAQYGSKSDKALEMLSKDSKGKSNYLGKIRKENNLRLGALYSGGKDSNLAMFIMKRQNYEISCLITMISEKDYSYMFQKTEKNIIKLQSSALGIPVVFGKTLGDKEEELKDLKKVLKKARGKYCLDGVITGALYSNYQRSRIFDICEELGLKVFSPLWHKPQEQELNELLSNNFKFIIVKTAAMGLDEKFIGREINFEDVKKLTELQYKLGINVAGEGGEYESLVIDSPLFNKKISIIEGEIKKESENNYDFIIKKTKLSKK